MSNLKWAILIIAFIGVCIASCDKTVKDHEMVKQPWVFPSFTKVDSLNPILSPSKDLKFVDPITKSETQWEERNVLNPTAVVRNDTVFLLYRAQDLTGTSRIGMAFSTDGLHFTKLPQPAFYPDLDSMKRYEWNYKKDETKTENSEDCYFCYFDGTEDPRIITSEEGTYIMTYTAYDGKTARLSLATSADLRHWQKRGLVLNSDKYRDLWSKSGAIVGELKNGQVIARKVDGKYWMYFGDTDLYIATSDDLVHWDVAENEESKKMISVLHPRPGYYDSRLVEPGPFALYTKHGIVLIYNGSNAANFNDQQLPKFTYAAGQALYDSLAPYKLLDRTESYFIHPDKEYEKVGEVNEVCFVEGLVYFNNRWFLYYGTADSKIAVAVAQ